MSAPIKAPNPHMVKIDIWPWGFRVPSKSCNGATRYVDLRPRRCDCPAGRHGKPCRHVRYVNEYAWATWKLIIHRMTQTKAGFNLLREIEAYVEHDVTPEPEEQF